MSVKISNADNQRGRKEYANGTIEFYLAGTYVRARPAINRNLTQSGDWQQSLDSNGAPVQDLWVDNPAKYDVILRTADGQSQVRENLAATVSSFVLPPPELPSEAVTGDNLDISGSGNVYQFDSEAAKVVLPSSTEKFPIQTHATVFNMDGSTISVVAEEDSGLDIRGPTSLDGSTLHSIYRASETVFVVAGKEAVI